MFITTLRIASFTFRYAGKKELRRHAEAGDIYREYWVKDLRMYGVLPQM
jgi:hypothetical protein